MLGRWLRRSPVRSIGARPRKCLKICFPTPINRRYGPPRQRKRCCRVAFDKSSLLSGIIKVNPKDNPGEEVDASFANVYDAAGNRFKSQIAGQLYQVAKMIRNHATIGGSSQVFFVSLGGFDTHDNQLSRQAALLLQLGDAMRAFYDATKQIGVASQVTTFTLSDFGRTLKSNASGGTDHG
jgi:hypothetical protein